MKEIETALKLDPFEPSDTVLMRSLTPVFKATQR